MLTFHVEPLSGCWDGVFALGSEHWKETEGYRHNQPFCPLFDRYNQYNQLGWLIVATARDGAELVGYAVMYLTPSMHTQQLIAVEDTYFLLPAYRKGRNAIELYKFVERECVTRGAVEITMTVKVTNHAGRILEYLDFALTGMQYTKQLSPTRADSAQQTQTEALHVCSKSSSTP